MPAAVPLVRPLSVICGKVGDCSRLAKPGAKPVPPKPVAALKPVEYWKLAL